MFERFCVLALALFLVWPNSGNAQMASEDLIRNHYLGELDSYVTRRIDRYIAGSGMDEADVRAVTESASAAVIDCFMGELEVVAMTNNIERTLFMDALAFAILWDSENEFFRQLEGMEHLGKSSEKCLHDSFEVQGVRMKRRPDLNYQ